MTCVHFTLDEEFIKELILKNRKKRRPNYWESLRLWLVIHEAAGSFEPAE
jgi:hypothetical protein